MNGFNQFIASEKCIQAIGIYDALSAALVEKKGFKAGWISGFSVSASLGIPDSNVMSINQYVARAKEIRSACSLHLIADCDEGYGSVENTLMLMFKLHEIGVEAVCIEDNLFPKINSFKDGNRLLEHVDLFSDKIRSIKKYIPELAVIARTEVLNAGGTLEEAVFRGKHYADAGADLIMIHSRYQLKDEFIKIVKHWGDRQPLAVVPTKAANITYKDFKNMGFNLVIYANQILRKSIYNIEKGLDQIAENCSIQDLSEDAVSMEYIFDLTDNKVTDKI